MMRNKPPCGPETERLHALIPVLDLAQPTVRFKRLPLPDMGLQFPPKPDLTDSRKRGRAMADIDGEHSCLQKKKRRLRLFLITSRLSPQFSHPATNIVDRGSSKIAVWAKQKALGRNLLRKAAILNRIRRHAVSARGAIPGRGRLLVEQEKEQRQLEMARLTFNYGSIDTYTRPVHTQPHLAPPSAATRKGNQYLFPTSPTTSPSSSPNTSRTPSPTLTSPLSNDNPPASPSPNAAYALSPPRIPSSSRTYEPLLPSPLGLFNYDALDVEDDTVSDTYAHLDDDEAQASFAYYWDEAVDSRHDTPFSNERDEREGEGASRALRTPPPPRMRMRGGEDGGADALLGGFDDDANEDVDVDVDVDEDGDEDIPSTWPSPFLDATPTTSTKNLYGSTNQRFSLHFPAPNPSPLAVRYPGEPVCTSATPSSVGRSRAAASPKLELAPACMSPNFLPVDSRGWAGEERWGG
ncbi:uncharacterized protein EKO05_0005377 [Ascochyta rabiei]|uniref:Uncharacterized protein n=1 Tax=Didymella rabiei TaxID=5454 RepID=A0A163JTH8_DIDRA|nr:uncharacterized protein EKO05_0005377 [Ascochyta rabiei]KZM26585.1 hypothetical protein ST47_g2238 [Ascochyta rabiei]UPX14906.1 hypothetical protein EKO05_0005377 [Ascochyta rabiei]